MSVMLLTCHLVGREYAGAIERKQVAQQEAERQKFVVQKADQERRATGESRQTYSACSSARTLL